MPDTLTSIEFRPLVIPQTMDDPDAGDFREMVRVRNLVYREISGHDDQAVPADELLPHLRSDEFQRTLVWVVALDDRFVGRIGVELPAEGDSKVAFWFIELLREVWNRGIGSAAYELVEQTARENQEIVQEVEKTHEVHDRLDADPAYRDRVRDRFTRPD